VDYFDREMLLTAFTSKDISKQHQLMRKVNRKKLEKDIAAHGSSAFLPLKCTTKPVVDKNYQKMSDHDQTLLRKIFEWVQGSKVEARRALKYLPKLKKTYPDVTAIYNYTAVAHEALGKTKKYHYYLKETLKKFPDYVFGKITLADYQLKHGSHEMIPDIFDHKLQLYMHYPDGIKHVFHTSEVQNFYAVMGAYYIRNKQLPHAMQCYFMIEQADKNSPHLDIIVQEIITGAVASLFVGNLEAKHGTFEV